MKVALPVSQYYSEVRSKLLPVSGALFIRQRSDLDKRMRGKDAIFHANGFIDDGFDDMVNNREFLSYINNEIELLSFDLGPSALQVKCHSSDGYITSHAPLSEIEIFNIAKNKIGNMRRLYKGPISLENLDYHPTGAYEHVCEPAFISKLINDLDLFFTLDIGHVEVTCNNLSLDKYEYLRKLPLSRVFEIHITHSPGAEDMHMLPTDQEYDLLDYVLGHSCPRYIVQEYHYEPDGMIDGVRRLVKFLKKRGCYEN
ncbi:DUF692 family multinuclear iron-containing protein [Candidatus Omnitrophota bacterium]